jgi:cytochrome c oxidase assembly factor CtaG
MGQVSPVSRSSSRARALVAGVALAHVVPGLASAHGGPDLPAPSAGTFLFDWGFDPLVWLPLIALAVAWRLAVRRVDRRHPHNRVPPKRSWFFYSGLVVVLIALDSGLAQYDTTLFSVHMVQHLLLTLVAPPLLALSAPITLLLRVASPGDRKRWILPVLHSRVLRAISFPPVAWLIFAGVMWASHFSPLFDVALENEWVHRLEHGLYLGAALLFWWPVCGVDPSPWRMKWPGRLLYLGLQMPQNTFLALAIYSATVPLYAHYATLTLPWLPPALSDQQVAGGIMWLAGDLLFLLAILIGVGAWMRAEEVATAREDKRLDAERAAIREREAILAARRAAERGSE